MGIQKFLVAFVAAVLIGLNEFFGIAVEYDAEGIVNVTLSLLASFGVYQITNK